MRQETVRTQKRVNVKKQKTKVTYSLTANPPATTTLSPATDPELAQDEVLETIQDEQQVGADRELIDDKQELDTVHARMRNEFDDVLTESEMQEAHARAQLRSRKSQMTSQASKMPPPPLPGTRKGKERRRLHVSDNDSLTNLANY